MEFIAEISQQFDPELWNVCAPVWRIGAKYAKQIQTGLGLVLFSQKPEHNTERIERMTVFIEAAPVPTFDPDAVLALCRCTTGSGTLNASTG